MLYFPDLQGRLLMSRKPGAGESLLVPLSSNVYPGWQQKIPGKKAGIWLQAEQAAPEATRLVFFSQWLLRPPTAL